MIRNFLSNLLATFTGPRYFPTFEWSKLWTHNAFRLFGMFFGEHYGIRPSVASVTGGKQIAYTLEAQLALLEVWTRSLFGRFAFKLVIIPQYQLAGFSQGGVLPYRFAIAFDAASGQQSNATAASNPALSHTCTGSNLFLSIWETGDLTTDTVTAITYNAVAATRVDAVQYPSDRWIYSYGLKSPSTGANNIVSSGNTFGGKAGISYTGCDTTTQPDAHAASYQSVASTDGQIPVTVVNSNCWLAGYIYGGGVTSAGSGTTLRGSNAGSGISTCDSNGTVATGAQILHQNQGSSSYIRLGMSIKPAGAAAVNSGFFFAAN